MNILFVSSGNRFQGVSPIVLSQGNSLAAMGLIVDYFLVNERGIRGYLKSLVPLRKKLAAGKYDLIHAHYYLCGILASLAGARPLVVSIMGSEARTRRIMRKLIRLYFARIWDRTIVKSKRTRNELDIPDAAVIPNGINSDRFRSIDRHAAKAEVGFNDGKHVVFMADPSRPEKNFRLAEKSFRLAGFRNTELHTIYDVDHNRVPVYMYAADVLLLTSLWEGSPNVVKEAMYCGLPIVATDVGDTSEIMSGINGCYITGFDPQDVAGKLRMALKFRGRTNGRKAIEHLDEKVIAEKLVALYKEVTNA